ncbi:MAG: hypothetical protein ABJF88_14145 [Rhodothermales bacterium]
MNEPRLFTLYRRSDESGVSGTGRVLDGVVFHNGKVVVCWRTDLRGGHSSIIIYDDWEAFEAVHVAPHPPEQTEIVFAEIGGHLPQR